MRRVFYAVPDASAEAINAALAQAPFFPPERATVTVQAELKVVVIATEEPWKADANGYEEGLGVPGWALLEAEVVSVSDPPPEVRSVDVVRATLDTLAEVVVQVELVEDS